MGLFDIFTGDPAIKAAEQQRAQYGQTLAGIGQTLSAGQAGGLAALQSGTGNATGAITGGVGTARGDIGSATANAIAALYGGSNAGAGALGAGQAQGLEALRSGVATAGGAYDPLAAAAGRYGAVGGAGSTMTADALGLNGPEGIARATQAFQAGPGYNFALNQGLESIARNANAAGMVASGNQLRESQTYGQGLANQEFQNWLQNVMKTGTDYSGLERGALGDVASGRSNIALTGGTGAANIYTGTAGRLADLYSGAGKGAADIYGTGGRSLADISTTGGQNLANIYTGQSGREADLISQIAQLSAGAQGGFGRDTAKTYADEAAASLAGSKNLWDLVGAGVSAAGGGGYLGSGLQSYFNRPTKAVA